MEREGQVGHGWSLALTADELAEADVLNQLFCFARRAWKENGRDTDFDVSGASVVERVLQSEQQVPGRIIWFSPDQRLTSDRRDPPWHVAHVLQLWNELGRRVDLDDQRQRVVFFDLGVLQQVLERWELTPWKRRGDAGIGECQTCA